MCKQNNQLPIELQTDVTSFLNIAYPLCLILSEPKLKNWYYEHFVHIFSQYWPELGFLRLDFLDSSKTFGDIIDRRTYDYSELQAVDIIGFIRKAVDSGYYLNVFTLDQYYLDQSPAYQKAHSIHETLIYGYDNVNEKLLAIGYNKENIFTKFEYDYKQFIEAFNIGTNNAPDFLPHPLHTIRLRKFLYDYPFDLGRFLKELRNYVYSTCDSKKKYFSIGERKDANYGFAIYDQIISSLKKKMDGDYSTYINYTAIHFLYEHKKMLNERLKYLAKTYNFDGVLLDLIGQFSTVTDIYNSVRLNWMRFSLACSKNLENLYFVKMDKPYLEKLAQGLSMAKEKEYALLENILEHLEKFQKTNSEAIPS